MSLAWIALALASACLALGLRFSKRTQEWVLPAAVAVALVALWDLACRFTGSVIFPTPHQTWLASLELVESQRLWGDVVASLFRVTWGFFLAAGVGIPLGLVIGWSTSS